MLQFVDTMGHSRMDPVVCVGRYVRCKCPTNLLNTKLITYYADFDVRTTHIFEAYMYMVTHNTLH